MRIEQARARFAQVAFASYLGVQLLELDHERAVLHLPFHNTLSNPSGVLNGGAMASLLNMAGTLAAWTGIDMQTEPWLETVDLSIQYLAAALEEDVIATARVLRRGRDLFFLEVSVRNTIDKPICQGLMIYRAPDYAGLPRRCYAQPVLLPDPTPVQLPEPIRQGGYHRKLQMALLHESPGRVRLTMPYTAQHMDERGQLHEGALASLLDLAGTTAAWTLAKRQGARGATVGMQLSYLNPAQEPVIADAQVQQRSEEVFFSTVQITAATTKQLVAMGNVSYRLLEARA
jgi:uncharacterized protein (TIGR00369 family)